MKLGSPSWAICSAADRRPPSCVLATNFGVIAAHAACRGDYGQMATLRNISVITVPIKESIAQL